MLALFLSHDLFRRDAVLVPVVLRFELRHEPRPECYVRLGDAGASARAHAPSRTAPGGEGKD